MCRKAKKCWAWVKSWYLHDHTVTLNSYWKSLNMKLSLQTSKDGHRLKLQLPTISFMHLRWTSQTLTELWGYVSAWQAVLLWQRFSSKYSHAHIHIFIIIIKDTFLFFLQNNKDPVYCTSYCNIRKYRTFTDWKMSLSQRNYTSYKLHTSWGQHVVRRLVSTTLVVLC